ncbi:hypothetical protein BC829DRAFT_409774, partial [Chytridium lagenaria]
MTLLTLAASATLLSVSLVPLSFVTIELSPQFFEKKPPFTRIIVIVHPTYFGDMLHYLTKDDEHGRHPHPPPLPYAYSSRQRHIPSVSL